MRKTVIIILLQFIRCIYLFLYMQRKEMDNLDTPTSLYEEFLASLRSSLSHDLSGTSRDCTEGSPDQTALTWRLDPLAQRYLSYLPVQLEKPAAEW